LSTTACLISLSSRVNGIPSNCLYVTLQLQLGLCSKQALAPFSNSFSSGVVTESGVLCLPTSLRRVLYKSTVSGILMRAPAPALFGIGNVEHSDGGAIAGKASNPAVRRSRLGSFAPSCEEDRDKRPQHNIISGHEPSLHFKTSSSRASACTENVFPHRHSGQGSAVSFSINFAFLATACASSV